MKVEYLYKGQKIVDQYNVAGLVEKKCFKFEKVLHKVNKKTGKEKPIQLEEKLMDLILSIYELEPEKFDPKLINGKITMNPEQRLNYLAFVYGNLPATNRILMQEKPRNKDKNKKGKSSKSAPREYDPEYTPYDAMNHRLPGSYGSRS